MSAAHFCAARVDLPENSFTQYQVTQTSSDYLNSDIKQHVLKRVIHMSLYGKTNPRTQHTTVFSV